MARVEQRANVAPVVRHTLAFQREVLVLRYWLQIWRYRHLARLGIRHAKPFRYRLHILRIHLDESALCKARASA